MVRFVIIGAVIAAAFTLYALVDAAMSDAARARGLSKPVWVVLIVVLPVIGAILWFTIGRARGPLPEPVRAPDDDPHFSGNRMSDAELERHMRELEDRLRELDEETFPGEEQLNDDSDTDASGDDGAGESHRPEDGPVSDGDADSRGESRRPEHPGDTPTSR